MTTTAVLSYAETNYNDDTAIWDNLKQAIAASSGFQCWQEEQRESLTTPELDCQVRHYLRQTLETLAY